jgi:hypothetical protein
MVRTPRLEPIILKCIKCGGEVIKNLTVHNPLCLACKGIVITPIKQLDSDILREYSKEVLHPKTYKDYCQEAHIDLKGYKKEVEVTARGLYQATHKDNDFSGGVEATI